MISILPFLEQLQTEEERSQFMQLYEMYDGLINKIAWDHLHHKEQAEDCAMQVYAELADRFEKVGDIASSRTKKYICTITERTAINIYNREKRIVSFPENYEDFVETDDSFFDAFDIVEIFAAMKACLTPEESDYLFLTYSHGYKSHELAKLYGVSDALIRKRLQLIKKRLRNKLGGDVYV